MLVVMCGEFTHIIYDQMNLSHISTILEGLTLLTVLAFVARKPKVAVFVCAAVAAALGALQRGSVAVAGGAAADGRSTMRAAFFAPGAPHDVLVRADVPIAVSHRSYEVFVKVTAAGLNPSNFKINFAKIPFVRHLSKYYVVGYDFVGEVRSVGSASSCLNFRVGDKIYGVASGSMAEFATAACATVGHAPTSLTDEQIAGLPVAALTSLDALHRGHMGPGKRSLVIGASGGTGVFGVTIGKTLGGHVTAICSARNHDFVNAFGPDRIVDYTSETEMQKLISEGRQFHMIYDTVTSFAAEDPDYEPSMRPLLLNGGKYVAINGFYMDWIRAVVDNFVVSPLVGRVGLLQRRDYELFLVLPSTQLIDELTGLFNSGRLTDVPIDSTFNLDEVSVHAAFDKMKGRRTKGKIVITISK